MNRKLSYALVVGSCLALAFAIVPHDALAEAWSNFVRKGGDIMSGTLRIAKQLAVGTTAAPLTTLHVQSAESTTSPGAAWNEGWLTVGSNAAGTSAAVGIAYDTTNDRGSIWSVAPNTAAKPLWLSGNPVAFSDTGGVPSAVATVSTAGLGTFNGGVKIGSTGTTITKSYGTSSVIDFASRTITCEDSTGITVTGAVAGDACSVGAPTTAAANSHFSCYVSAADTVKVRHCPAGTASDPASATYYVRVFSQQ